MAQGFKKNTAKKKQKMVLAKDKNQLILAVVVMCIFFGNSIYMAVKYFNEQQTYSNPQPAQQAASSFPIWIVVLVVIVLLAVVGAVGFILKNKNLGNLIDSSKKAAATSKQGKAGKMVLAKDKNQLILALVVMAIFFGNTIYMIIKYFQNQAPPPTVSSQTAKNLALEQRKNLEAMNNPNMMNTAQTAGQVTDPNSLPMENPATSPIGGPMAAGPNSMQSPQSLQSPTMGGASDDGVDVLTKKKILKGNQKMVLISVDNSGRQNPFLPANDISGLSSGISNLPFLAPPPETLQTQSDAGKVMTTTISGILYDKYNPSAIINIEGTDYLVKKGDVINSYKILLIGKTQVIVQLGKNVYKAGVGELLTQTDMNYNTVANLNKKFGGNEVSINVKKKGY